MKKILALMAVLLVMFAMPLAVFAEETTAIVEETETEAVTETETEIVTEAETEPTTEEPTETDAYVPPEEVQSLTDKIMAYIQAHLEEISVIVTLILSILYQIRKHHTLNKSIGTLNNNAVLVAERSSAAINTALEGVDNASAVVGGYKTDIEAILAEYRMSAEDRKRLQQALTDANNLLTTAKLANVELANEVAELLVLANIPNSKKDELYSRHRAAVDAIASAEARATEVNDNDSIEE